MTARGGAIAAREAARHRSYDAVIVGAGPNGLCAAIALAREGLGVLLVEGREAIGGGARTEALTLPGFSHDVCSAIHPMARLSPFLRSLPAIERDLTWIEPAYAVGHPLDGGDSALLARDIGMTVSELGADGAAWRELHSPLLEEPDGLFPDLLGPLGWPREPLRFARFGLDALRSATSLARSRFGTERARALFAGCAAHSIVPLEWPFSASFGLVLSAAAHVVGWPFPRGGSQKLTEVLAAELIGLGGEIVTRAPVRALGDLPESRAVLFDVSPRALARIAGDALPASYRRRLRAFRQGPGVFKLDFALDGPIPWRDPALSSAGTVHVGGSLDEIAASERAAFGDRASPRPFVLVAQHSLFDPTRAPPGKHTVWAYCHVPTGCTDDQSDAIERQIERFAPGFRDRILHRSRRGPADLERENPNLIGGDIGGGSNAPTQLFTRPVVARVPYATPNPRLFLCSASTPPGGGVHGMCGWHAARAALERVFGKKVSDRSRS